MLQNHNCRNAPQSWGWGVGGGIGPPQCIFSILSTLTLLLTVQTICKFSCNISEFHPILYETCTYNENLFCYQKIKIKNNQGSGGWGTTTFVHTRYLHVNASPPKRKFPKFKFCSLTSDISIARHYKFWLSWAPNCPKHQGFLCQDIKSWLNSLISFSFCSFLLPLQVCYFIPLCIWQCPSF